MHELILLCAVQETHKGKTLNGENAPTKYFESQECGEEKNITVFIHVW